MDHYLKLSMSPAPGEILLQYCGDKFDIKLSINASVKGRAFVRTNLNQSAKIADWLISAVEEGTETLNEAWVDLPMIQIDESTFSLTCTALEVGHFEFKTYFVPEQNGEIVWPDGHNVTLKVEPSDYRSHNSI